MKLSGNLAGNLGAPEALSPLDQLGAQVRNRWKVWAAADSNITIVSSRIHVITDVGSVPSDMTQSVAAERPNHTDSGGPNDKPYLSLTGNAYSLPTTADIGLASGHRSGVFCVFAGNAANRSWLQATDDDPAAFIPLELRRLSGGEFGANSSFVDAAQNLTITTPAYDTDWHYSSSLSLSTGNLHKIDGVEVDPQWTDDSGWKRVHTISFGTHLGNTSSGYACEILIVSDVDAAAEALIAQYMSEEYGL